MIGFRFRDMPDVESELNIQNTEHGQWNGISEDKYNSSRLIG